MTPFLRPWLHGMPRYSPGRHASTEAYSLASNEAPYPPPRQVLDAIAAAGPACNRYPDPLAKELRSALADYHGVAPESILLGNGSDELIYLIVTAYLAQGGAALVADPGYRLNVIAAQRVNAHVIPVPLLSWTHDLETMARYESDVAFIVNPHNPTGTVASARSLREFVDTRRSRMVVVDEAYIDFADHGATESAIPFAARDDVIVLRTFSKFFGLAGLRVGYLIATPAIVDELAALRAPFSVSGVAQAAALAALRAVDHYAALRSEIIGCREELTRQLQACGIPVVESQANFVLIHSVDEDDFLRELGERGISARGGSTLGVSGTVRLTVPGSAALPAVCSAIRGMRLHSTV